MCQETEIFPITPSLPPPNLISELLSSSQDGLGAVGLVGGGGQGGEEAGRGLGQAHRPGGLITSLEPPPGTFTTHQCPPSGTFTTHYCHLLQVSLQHITATFSCPRGRKTPCTGGGSIINEVTLSSFLLLPFSSCSWFCSSSWTLDTGH